MKLTKFVAIAAVATFSTIGSAQAYVSSAKGEIYGNRAAQLLCKYWVDKVERNSTTMQGWLVRHTVGLSGNKLGAGYTKYAKYFTYTVGNNYRELLVNVSWELRDVNYVIARNPNIDPETKMRRCESNGEQSNASVVRLWDRLNPSGDAN